MEHAKNIMTNKEYLKRLLEGHRFWQTMYVGERVPAQQLFPNCQKYDPCCDESGTEEMMKKFKAILDKPIERISHQAKKGNRINIIKKVKPVKKNPFLEEDVLGSVKTDT